MLKIKFGLALGGGAAKGAAHLGVLKAIHEQNLELQAIAGTSVGAIIAALYAFGKTLDEIFAIAENISLSHVSGFTLKKKGFSTTERLEKLLIEHLGDVNIEDARIPLAIVASNIRTGKKQVFTQGSLAKAVAASTAVPGLFVPVEIDGEEYVDGGLLENVPISPLKRLGANTLIAVDLDGGDRFEAPQNVMDVLSNALDIAINHKTRQQLKLANFVICLNLREFSRTDNRERTAELVELAYKEASKRLQRVRWHWYFPVLQSFLRFYRRTTPIAMPNFLKEWRERR